MRSPSWAATPAAAAAALSGFRWLQQGSGNIYTDANRSFYVPDPDLGWRIAPDGPPWLGLDAIALLVGVSLMVLAVAWVGKRNGLWAKKPRAVVSLWLASISTFVIPVWALQGGGRPQGAVDRPPGSLVATPVDAGEGVVGRLSLAAGTYIAQPVEETSVVATLTAGGETFEARFPTLARGVFRGDPADLTQPMSARVEFLADSVKTGIDLRDKHAREKLLVESHPTLTFELVSVLAVRLDKPGSLSLRASGRVALAGREHTVDVQARVSAATKEVAERFKLVGDAFVVDAEMSLDLTQTVIGNDGTFDQNRVPIRTRLFFSRSRADAPAREETKKNL